MFLLNFGHILNAIKFGTTFTFTYESIKLLCVHVYILNLLNLLGVGGVWA